MVESTQAPISDKLAGIDQSLLSRSRPPFAHPRTREFLQAVIKEGGTIIPEGLRDQSEGRIRAREQNLIGAYFSSQARLRDLGQIYRNEATSQPITGEAIRQVIEHGMRRLWENSSDKVKESFPWQSIPLNKPWSLKSRIQALNAHSGTVSGILEDIQQGKNYSELRTAGRSSREISTSRQVLRRWGFSGNLPYGHLHGEARNRFIEQLASAETPEQVGVLFRQIEMRNFMHETINKGTLPLTKLGEVLLACGFNPRDIRNRHFFIDVLRAGGVIVGHTETEIKGGMQAGKIQRYYFMRSKDVSRAEEILRNDPALVRFLKR